MVESSVSDDGSMTVGKDGMPKQEIPEELPAIPNEVSEMFEDKGKKEGEEKAPDELPKIEGSKNSDDGEKDAEAESEQKDEESASEEKQTPETSDTKKESSVTEPPSMDSSPSQSDKDSDEVSAEQQEDAKSQTAESQSSTDDVKPLQQASPEKAQTKSAMKNVGDESETINKFIDSVVREGLEIDKIPDVEMFIRSLDADSRHKLIENEEEYFKREFNRKIEHLKQLQGERYNIRNQLFILKKRLFENAESIKKAYGEIQGFVDAEKKKSMLIFAAEDTPFYFCDGSKVSSLQGLMMKLENMSEEEFAHHVNDERNDFAFWIIHSFGEKELAEKIKKASSKEKIISMLEDFFSNIG